MNFWQINNILEVGEGGEVRGERRGISCSFRFSNFYMLLYVRKAEMLFDKKTEGNSYTHFSSLSPALSPYHIPPTNLQAEKTRQTHLLTLNLIVNKYKKLLLITNEAARVSLYIFVVVVVGAAVSSVSVVVVVVVVLVVARLLRSG